MAKNGGKNLTRKEIEGLAAQVERGKTKLANVAEKAKGTIEFFVTSLEIGAVSYGFGLSHGLWSDPETGKTGLSILNVPAELLAYLGFAALSLGVGKKWSGHTRALAYGSLSTYSTIQGVDMGRRMALRRQSADEEEETTETPAVADASEGDRGKGRRNFPGTRARGPSGSELRGLASRLQEQGQHV